MPLRNMRDRIKIAIRVLGTGDEWSDSVQRNYELHTSTVINDGVVVWRLRSIPAIISTAVTIAELL